MNITYEQVKSIVRPKGKRDIIESFVTYFNKHADTFGVNNYNRVCHAVAQMAHECDGFNVMEEYASGAAYEGRKDLGNTQKGDGRRFRGRGFIQITGRANYREFGKIIGYDLENNPHLAEDPEISVLTSLAFWQKKKLNDLADANNVNAITKRINGGYNGLEDRKLYLSRARSVFKDVSFDDEDEEQTDVSVENFVELKFGSKGSRVRELQEKLVEYGYKVNVDSAFGPATKKAVEELQSDLDMDITGIVNKDLWDILEVGIEDSE